MSHDRGCPLVQAHNQILCYNLYDDDDDDEDEDDDDYDGDDGGGDGDGDGDERCEGRW